MPCEKTETTCNESPAAIVAANTIPHLQRPPTAQNCNRSCQKFSPVTMSDESNSSSPPPPPHTHTQSPADIIEAQAASQTYLTPRRLPQSSTMNSSDTGCSSGSLKSGTGNGSLNYSSATDINAISSVDIPVGDDDDDADDAVSCLGLKYLPSWPAINLEFRNLCYDVPDAMRPGGTKRILNNINGHFRSHELTAIMGPSGAGKTTLLNLLAGFGGANVNGTINVNNNPRDMKVFRKMSRYIMQHDILNPHFTVGESMMLAANLKLGNELNMQQKIEVIDEILVMLRLKKAENTRASLLSGGEKKRLCIAMELVNNPPVIFLDEPTTGLDDLSSSQCISLLRRIAHSGRTIICSIHTPSAKIFDMFDKVYVLAQGECIYQGSGSNIVPYMRQLGLQCPITYNPADFVIEVACGEYGTGHHTGMVSQIDNGRVYRWSPDYNRIKAATPTKSEATSSGASSYDEVEQFEEELDVRMLVSKTSWWMQYRLLLDRMLVQMWRDRSYMRLKFVMNIVLALIVGGIFQGTGNDASKALFNFGFLLSLNIAYLYLPMMPVLLQFPTEIKFLKREYYNQWYRFSSYYAAMMSAKMPYMLFLGFIFLFIVYLMTSQPLELFRFSMTLLISILVSMISDSFGLLVSSRLSIVNAMFLGPVLVCPIILLSVFGLGYGKTVGNSPFMRFLMSLSFLRHGMEGMLDAMYGYDRTDTVCPPTEMFCMFKKSKYFLTMLGFTDCDFWNSVSYLVVFYMTFSVASYILIKNRLTMRSSQNVAVQYVSGLMRKYLNFTSYHY